MEITLDIGKNVYNDMSKIAKNDNVEIDIMALKLLELGIRVHLASNTNDDEHSVDPILSQLLNKVMENNYLLKETLGHVFNKDKSRLKTYDDKTSIAVIENMAKSFMDGKFSL